MDKTTRIIGAALAAAILAPAPARAGQPLVCKEAAVAAAPTQEQLDACVAPAPISMEIALGYALGGSLSGFARADKRVGPLWLSGRARYDLGGVAQLDALGGLVLWHRHGVAWDTWSTAPSGGTRTVISNKTVMRKALILAGGMKAARCRRPGASARRRSARRSAARRRRARRPPWRGPSRSARSRRSRRSRCCRA